DGLRRCLLGRVPARTIAGPRSPWGRRSRLRDRGPCGPGSRYRSRRLRPRGRRALRGRDPPARVTSFTWIDGERMIRFAAGAAAEAPALLGQHGFEGFVLLATQRAASQAPMLADAASAVLEVPGAPVPEAAAAVRSVVGCRPLVALGRGRVIDA